MQVRSLAQSTNQLETQNCTTGRGPKWHHTRPLLETKEAETPDPQHIPPIVARFSDDPRSIAETQDPNPDNWHL